ncbi:Type I transmembrane sorting receptor [Cadophora gregata]|uniref:Type I transmembrane sorting receptor n=1 Tax=Cadophora gregata TaxID=51156 RepID=UPI0026DC158F|nr:Type I transmembrane sorting receptor [Cadophora gregata]KAK0105359.1 Type I transmembrane sorting receptor [Cadophora gregata f. sp. sojae]KAK0105744.1 Type I transmembrane sorting receptor [Cadophora gregata]
MLYPTLSILVLALGASAAPAPAPGVNVVGSKAFSAPAVYNANFHRNGTAAMLKAYAKHNLTPTKEMPAEFLAALQKRQDGSATAFPADGVQYLVTTSVGGQRLDLDLDTGSAELWVFSSQLAASSKTGHHIYTSSQSSTYKELPGYTWDITYADGSGASGNVGTDTVKIGGTTVTGQAIQLAKQVSSAFVSYTADGLVGLAFNSLNTVSPVQQKTFFDNAKRSLKAPLFVAHLPRQASGSFDFGYIDASKHSGTVQYATVDSSGGFWEFPSTSFKVGSTVHPQSGFTAIADTGTTLLLTGDTAVDTYYASVPGAQYSSSQGGYIFPCSATLPSFSVRIGSTAYATIPGSLMSFGSAGGSSCFGSLQSAGRGTQNVYGDVLFNAYLGVFDASVPRFGFAPIA